MLEPSINDVNSWGGISQMAKVSLSTEGGGVKNTTWFMDAPFIQKSFNKYNTNSTWNLWKDQ